MEKPNFYDIIISKRAEENLDKIASYLLSNWSEKVKNAFIVKFKNTINVLSSNPFVFEEFSKKKRIRRCFITKHNALYFRLVGNTVEIITIHDTRRNMKSLSL